MTEFTYSFKGNFDKKKHCHYNSLWHTLQPVEQADCRGLGINENGQLYNYRLGIANKSTAASGIVKFVRITTTYKKIAKTILMHYH